MPHTSRYILLLLAVSGYCLLVLPRMLTYGMFVDGVTYASIARNMAENYGSFWRPYYTATVYPTFYEHPPLGFWLQSWAYRLCGDSVYVEAWWGCIAGALILVGLGCVWQYARPQGYPSAGTWLPILLFVTIPMTSWILSNNMLENTMTVFIMASVCASLLSLKSSKKPLSIFYGLLAGFNTFLAFLVKGPVALFTIIIPLLSMIKKDERYTKIFVTNFCVLFALLLSLCIFIFNNAEALYTLRQYANQQIIASINGTRDVSRSPFNMLYAIFREMLVPVIGGGLLTVLMARRKKIAMYSINYRLFLYYLCIALSGSLPLLISSKQMRWYVFPSLPFYTLATAVVFNDIGLLSERFLNQHAYICKNMRNFSICILMLSIVFMVLGKNYLGRDKDFHNDFSIQPLYIEEREMISVSPENLAKSWSLIANMQRKFKASLVKDFGHTYLLTTTAYENAEDISSRYTLLHPPHPQKYLLFRLKH
jgi:dolichyl-phosphate-mannose-protein mannosyltransferase